MLTFKMIIVFFGLIGMVTALVLDKMRPGMILFSVTVLFLCFGILTPKEILEGFSNKGMITVALLFLISEGVRQSGALGQLIKKLLPQEKTTVMKAQARISADAARHSGRQRRCGICAGVQAVPVWQECR